MTLHAILSDLHVPDHNVNGLAQFIQWVRTYTPNSITIIGDFIDCKAPSRWSKGTADEFGNSLQSECDDGVRILSTLRRVHDGPIYFHLGNHENRIADYLKTKAPAFASLEGLKIENLLQFNEFQVQRVGRYHPVSGRWMSCHGDVAASLSTSPGGTALGIAKRTGYSIVCGHTHRLGVQSYSTGIGSTELVVGFEVGHLQDVSTATYIEHGSPDWQLGFGVLDETDSGMVQPMPVYLNPIGE